MNLEPNWLYGLRQYILRVPCFRETEYVKTPDVPLEGNPHLQLINFIIQRLNTRE
jgi:hypothetical protein